MCKCVVFCHREIDMCKGRRYFLRKRAEGVSMKEYSMKLSEQERKELQELISKGKSVKELYIKGMCARMGTVPAKRTG